jgi:phosphoserine aminotransferase
LNPNFSSGPCRKRPGWSLQSLQGAVLGRSHRSKEGKSKLREVIDLTRNVLSIPDEYRIAIVPGSDTGAVEMALWGLLGPRGVDVCAHPLHRIFGHDVGRAVSSAGRVVWPDWRPVHGAQSSLPFLSIHDILLYVN